MAATEKQKNKRKTENPLQNCFFFRFICSEHVGPISFICDDERASGRKKNQEKQKRSEERMKKAGLALKLKMNDNS